MVNYFEQLTSELSENELDKILPEVKKILETKIGKVNIITNSKIIKTLKGDEVSTSPARVRKIIQHIRLSGEIPLLMATNRGYYISNNKEELDKYIESLHQRADSILYTANQIQWQVDQKFRGR